MSVKFLGAVLGIGAGVLAGMVTSNPLVVSAAALFVYEVILVGGKRNGV